MVVEQERIGARGSASEAALVGAAVREVYVVGGPARRPCSFARKSVS